MPKQVLIVDECPLMRTGMKALLASEADLALCGEAETGRAAIELARTTRPDLAIVDIALRDRSGLELVRRLKDESATLSILVCSNLDESMFAKRAMRLGALGYVRKNAPVAMILSAVRQVRAGKPFLSDAMVEQLLNGLVRKGAEGDAPGIETLSDRELEVFGLIGQGESTRAIAERLRLSVKTVETHREKIKRKLGSNGSSDLVRRAVEWQLDAGSGGRDSRADGWPLPGLGAADLSTWCGA